MRVKELQRALEKCPKRATIHVRDGFIEGTIENVYIVSKAGQKEVYFELGDDVTVTLGENDGEVISR